MLLAEHIKRLWRDPPPEFVFELSEAGMAWARRGPEAGSGFAAFEPGVISVSPLRDNLLEPDPVRLAVERLAPRNGKGGKKRRAAALILPDYCGRVTVLDFDSFPQTPQEQLSLVRFRVKKSVPFDLDAASVSYSVQPGANKKLDVVVAVVSYEILARYEAPFRAAGLHPGFVTISSLAALNLLPPDGREVYARLCGKALTVAVTVKGNLRLFRCVELDHVEIGEIADVLFPTFAYVEDELGGRPERLLLAGFGEAGSRLVQDMEQQMGVPVEPLHSRFGATSPYNAGLQGYMESMGEAWR